MVPEVVVDLDGTGGVAAKDDAFGVTAECSLKSAGVWIVQKYKSS
jgi:hypothetical protein